MNAKKNGNGFFTLVLLFVCVTVSGAAFYMCDTKIYQPANDGVNSNVETDKTDEPIIEIDEPTSNVKPDEPTIDFEVQRKVCCNSSNASVKHSAAVKMAKVAKSVNDWEWICLCANSKSDLEIIAVQHMSNISIKSGDIRDMCTAAVSANWTDQMELMAEIVKAMVVVANKNNEFDSWFQVCIVTKYMDTRTHSIALDKMKKTAITANDWVWVYDRAPKGSELRKVALQKLNKLTPSFYNWWDIALKSKHDDDITFNMALDKMSQTANSFYDWKLVYQWAPPDSELKKLALKKMTELAD